MELKEKTKRGIERTTGVPFSNLLEVKPGVDPRLKRLRSRRAPVNPDLLVKGSPQLTMGYVTKLDTVDAYFDKKTKERRDEVEHRDREKQP